MQVHDAYVFSNASAIVYDYYPLGTLLVTFLLSIRGIFTEEFLQDLSNMYKSSQTDMGGMLATYFAIQIAAIVEQVHKAQIIHADVKPDNFVLVIPYVIIYLKHF
jgi:serine/threonine protein kinase